MLPYSLDKYSRFVNTMKVLLPIGILLVLGLPLGWPYIMSLNAPEERVRDEAPEHDRMIHPHYMSTDQKGQPYEVTATVAEQTGNESPTYLTNPKGTISTETGNAFDVKAEKGTYEEAKKELTLRGKVVVTSTDGYKVETEKALVRIDPQIVEGNGPVKGEGPKGTVEAKAGFQIKHQEKGDIITLKGPSRVVIHQGQ